MKRGFTMLEILIAVVVLAILASIAMVNYQGYRDRVTMMVDATNQKVLAAAVKIYAYDTGALPGSLSDLRSRDLDRAFAGVSKGKRPYTMLAHWRELIQQAVGIPVAYAEFLPSRYYNGDLKVISCPKDPDPPTGFNASGKPMGGKSYEIAPEFKGKPLSFILATANKNKTLIFESDEAGSPEFRHRNRDRAVVTSPGGESGVSDPSDPNPPDVPGRPLLVSSSGGKGRSRPRTP